LGLGLRSESGGGSDSLVSLTEGVVGITDLLVSVGDLGLTFGLLSTVHVVVGNLFSVNGVLEALENKVDGLNWTSGLELRFNLQHDAHDRSLLGEVEGVSRGVGCASKGDH